MRLLPGSGGFRPDQRRARYVERMQRHFGETRNAGHEKIGSEDSMR
ncbi:MAG: hypothetical protein GY741_17340 [Phycisphaeraceae bacterium]|nr:hypothetical protein [Phycisphaeraceae bacterium]